MTPPSAETLIQVLQKVTGMNVNINYNDKAWPLVPWEVQYYPLEGGAAEALRDKSLRVAVGRAIHRSLALDGNEATNG